MVLVYFTFENEYLEHLKLSLVTFKHADVKINPFKRSFLKQEIHYLEPLLSP